MISRRNIMKGMFAAGGLNMINQPLWAQDAGLKEHVFLWVQLNGGYSPIQTSAMSFLNNEEAVRFGCSDNNILVMNEISCDQSTFGQLPQVALDRFACIGSTGASNHNSGKHFWLENGVPTPLQIAAGMGGNAAIKAAKVGDVAGAPGGAHAGISLESVNDIASALEALTGKGQTIPQELRPAAGKILSQAFQRSLPVTNSNPSNLLSLTNGYDALVKSMTQPAEEVNVNEITTAYNMNGTAITNDFTTKMAAAEVLFKSGVKVVCVGHGTGTYWDDHDDNFGTRQRTRFGEMMAGLSTFSSRMLGTDKYNVTIAFMSEHTRIPQINNHGPDLSCLVISDSVNGGLSTGTTDKDGLIPNAPPPLALKSCLAELNGLRGSSNPFGANPHSRIVKA